MRPVVLAKSPKQVLKPQSTAEGMPTSTTSSRFTSPAQQPRTWHETNLKSSSVDHQRQLRCRHYAFFISSNQHENDGGPARGDFDPQPIAGLYNAQLSCMIYGNGLIQEGILTMITIQVGRKRSIDREALRLRGHDDDDDDNADPDGKHLTV